MGELVNSFFFSFQEMREILIYSEFPEIFQNVPLNSPIIQIKGVVMYRTEDEL
jgi:hypothetical protein